MPDLVYEKHVKVLTCLSKDFDKYLSSSAFVRPLLSFFPERKYEEYLRKESDTKTYALFIT